MMAMLPHIAKGAIAQAWSVAELLRMREMLKGHFMYKASAQKRQEETISI